MNVSAVLKFWILALASQILVTLSTTIINTQTLPKVELLATSSVEECLPEAEASYVGSCTCSSIRDIRCQGLKTIPKFLSLGNQTYGGLYMSGQAIRQVPAGIFANIPAVKIVLSFNPIGDNLDSKAFSGLENVLQELLLADCGLKALPSDLLTGLTKLRYLYLWGNQITSIPPNFFKPCGNLLELSLWGNKIARLEEGNFVGLSKLKKLDLDRNKISELKRDAFRDLLELEILHLGENSIQSLPSEVFSILHKLRVLSLDGNQINKDGLMPKMTHGNKRARKAFYGLGNLQSLALNDNHLTTIPGDTFSPLHNLLILSLQNNRLQTIWQTTFSGLNSLQRLDLSNNSLDELPPAALNESHQLRHLYLDHNQLRRLKCFLSSASLGGSAAAGGDRAGKVVLRTLSLLGNSIECDCRLKWLMSLHEKHGVAVWGTCSEARSTDPSSVISKDSYQGLSCSFGSGECKQ